YPWRLQTRLRLNAAGLHGLGESRIVALVLVCVELGELADRVLERGAATEVGRHRNPVAGAGVGARERPRARPPVGREPAGAEHLDRCAPLPVPELPDVVVARLSVEAARDVRPAQERVARRLHPPLALDDTLAVRRVLAVLEV